MAMIATLPTDFGDQSLYIRLNNIEQVANHGVPAIARFRGFPVEAWAAADAAAQAAAEAAVPAGQAAYDAKLAELAPVALDKVTAEEKEAQAEAARQLVLTSLPPVARPRFLWEQLVEFQADVSQPLWPQAYAALAAAGIVGEPD